MAENISDRSKVSQIILDVSKILEEEKCNSVLDCTKQLKELARAEGLNKGSLQHYGAQIAAIRNTIYGKLGILFVDEISDITQKILQTSKQNQKLAQQNKEASETYSNASLKQANNLAKSTRTLAIVTGVMAFATVVLGGLGYWSERSRQAHEKISVRPSLSTTRHFNTERGVMGDMTLTLRNGGMGPAVVKWSSNIVQGVPVRHWEEVVAKIGWPKPIHLNTSHMRPNESLPPGYEKVLFRMEGKQNLAPFYTHFEKIDFTICYCSIYDECWQYSSVMGNSKPGCDPKPKVIFDGIGMKIITATNAKNPAIVYSVGPKASNE